MRARDCVGRNNIPDRAGFGAHPARIGGTPPALASARG